ncbi:methionyl-tRNA formyltransferase [Burkholderiales bacterium]|nr:methionyl-tRNA formyltransferase [Burkholderiales bacterium]
MSPAPARAVAFAYHNVGARCLRVLLAHGIDVPLVVTHADDPAEALWFERVSDVADDLGIAWIAPPDANDPRVVARIAALAPDFLFSFYYRRMLGAPLLAAARRGALNMHGSLLPKYRGRAPVNWAVLMGERETGATLHDMAAKPDAGGIVDQQRVPILPDDTAKDVFDKVTVAAEIVLDRALPGVLDGTAVRRPNDLAAGSYFGGRTPEDGRVDWSWPARRVHDLVRAVAPPFPGAFCDLPGGRLAVLRTRVLEAAPPNAPAAPGVFVSDGRAYARCGDGTCVAILSAAHAGASADAFAVAALATRAR